MYFIKKFIDPKNILVIEIWTYKVKIACCQYKNNEITVLWYAEQRQEQTNIIAWEIASIEWVWESINACLEKLYKEIEVIPKEIIINIASNLVFSFATKLNYTRGSKNDKIDISELDNIIWKIEKQALKKAKLQINKQTWYNDVDTKLITSTITDLQIDWLKVVNPIWFVWENVELSVLNVFIPASRYNILTSLARNLSKKIDSIIPVEISIPKLFEKSNYAFEDVLFINVWFNKTSFILQKKWVIMWFSKIDIWINELIKYIKSKHSQITTIEILKKLDDENSFIEEKKQFLSIWEEWLYISLKDLLPNILIPTNICMLGEWNYNFLKNWLNPETLAKNNMHCIKKFNFIENEFEYKDLIKGKTDFIKNNNLSLVSMILAWNEISSQKTNIVVKIINNFLKKNT